MGKLLVLSLSDCEEHKLAFSNRLHNISQTIVFVKSHIYRLFTFEWQLLSISKIKTIVKLLRFMI